MKRGILLGMISKSNDNGSLDCCCLWCMVPTITTLRQDKHPESQIATRNLRGLLSYTDWNIWMCLIFTNNSTQVSIDLCYILQPPLGDVPVNSDSWTISSYLTDKNKEIVAEDNIGKTFFFFLPSWTSLWQNTTGDWVAASSSLLARDKRK